jgi:hypothetical protein
MATKVLYMDTFDEMGWRPTSLDSGYAAPFPNIATSGSGSGVDEDATSSVWSRYSMSTTASIQLTSTVDPSITPSERYVSYSYLMKFTNANASLSSDSWVIICADHPSGVATGTVAIGWVVDTNADQVYAQIYYYSGGAWNLIGGSAGTAFAIPDGPALWTLEVDKGTGTNQRARILKDGTAYSNGTGGWNSNTNIATTHPSGAGAINGLNISAAKNGTLDYKVYGMHVIESDTEDVTSLTSYGTYAYYPSSMGDASGLWAVNGQTTCVTELWRAIDDAEDTADGANDYLTETAGASPPTSDSDVLFGFPDVPSGALASGAVGVMLVILGATPTQVEGLVKYSGTTEAITMTLVGNGNACIAMLPTAPGSVAWTESVFNAIQAGIRVKSSQAPSVYGLHLAITGIGLARHSKATACPANSRNYAILL